MSFSSEVKKELYQIIPTAGDCREAELAAVLYCIGSFSVNRKNNKNNAFQLTLHSDTSETVRKCFTLIQKIVKMDYVADLSDFDVEKRTGTVPVKLPSETIRDLAVRMGVSDGSEVPGREDYDPAALLETRWKRQDARRAFLREAFVCIGSVSDPEKEYHLEFACDFEQQADQIRRILQMCGISAKIIRRKKYYIVYLKDSSDISQLLNMMGAVNAFMKLENMKIWKDVRNSVNRRVNCETANITKMVSASQKQIEDIRLLEQSGILRTLPDSLRLISELRLEHPEVSLKELGEFASPPISKSAVNHRMRRISEIADQSRGKQKA